MKPDGWRDSFWRGPIIGRLSSCAVRSFLGWTVGYRRLIRIVVDAGGKLGEDARCANEDRIS
jgi:hypothetical protein